MASNTLTHAAAPVPVNRRFVTTLGRCGDHPSSTLPCEWANHKGMAEKYTLCHHKGMAEKYTLCPREWCLDEWIKKGWKCRCQKMPASDAAVQRPFSSPCQEFTSLTILHKNVLEAMPRGSADSANCQSNLDRLKHWLDQGQ